MQKTTRSCRSTGHADMQASADVVQCDKTKPTCERCQKSNFQCDGYEQFPTFINRTSSGMMRRTRLEEVILPKKQSRVAVGTLSSSDATSSSGTTPASPPSTARSLVSSSRSEADVRYRALLRDFEQVYFPKRAADRTSPTLVWLEIACALDSPGQVLRLGLHALAASRVGFSRNDESLSLEARKIYGEALQALVSTLNTTDALRDDEILAAARALMIFEVSWTPPSASGRD